MPYYAQHQGALLFGRAITAVHFEFNADGSGLTYPVQWFERGRLEYHEQLAAQYQILPGLVGKEALHLARL